MAKTFMQMADEEMAKAHAISADEALKQLKQDPNALLVDVRSRRIITTCGSSPCYRGASAANLLTEMGFSNVSYVEGGMKALLAAGLPTE